MRKYILFLIIFMFSVKSNSQIGLIFSAVKSIQEDAAKSKQKHEINRSLVKTFILNDSIYLLRISEEKIKSPSKQFIVKVQNCLTVNYEQYKSEKKTDLQDINNYIGLIKSYDNDWPIKYYQTELNKYADYNEWLNIKCQNEKRTQDSIKQLKLDSVELIVQKQKQLDIEQKKQTEYVEKQSDPYQIIKRHLDGISEVGYGTFTYFRGLDYNFASTRFQVYLQDEYMNLTPDPRFKSKGKPNQYCLRFVPHVSTEDEFLKVIFNFEKRKGYVSYYPIYKDGSSDIITSVEMIGTIDIMIKLFINYWPSRIKLGGYKIGEIAHYQIMGDYVSLVGVSTKICKILITHGNIEANYYTTFKIKALD